MFRECARAAKRHFEAGNWLAIQHVARERLLDWLSVKIHRRAVLLIAEAGYGKTTLLAVGNALAQPVEAQIEVRSNWGIPVSTLTIQWEAHELKSFNLRDWIVQGKMPTRSLRLAERDEMKASLTGKRSPKDNLLYSSPVAPDLAVGSVIIRTTGARPEIATCTRTRQWPKFGTVTSARGATRRISRRAPRGSSPGSDTSTSTVPWLAPGATRATVPSAIPTLDRARRIVVLCHHGMRSAMAAEHGFGAGCVDFVFLDHDKNAYLSDLQSIRSRGWRGVGVCTSGVVARVHGRCNDAGHGGHARASPQLRYLLPARRPSHQRHGRLLLDRFFLRFAGGFGLVEDAGDGSKRMIGRVALIQNLKPPGMT